LIACGAALSALRSRPGRFHKVVLLLAFACGNAAFAVSALSFGPFILGPSIGVVHTMMYTLMPGRRFRAFVLLSGCAAVVAPWLVDRAGWLSPSFLFENGTLRILPRVFELPPELTVATILITSLSAVLIASVFVMRYRDALRAAEEKLHLYTWHLGHLVPKDAGQ